MEYISDKKLPNKAKLLYSCKTQDDIILQQPLEELAQKNANIGVEFSLTREPQDSNWTGRRGRIDEQYIKESLQDFDIDKTGCYLCGTPNFVQSMVNLLMDAGIKEDKIWHERWE